MIAPFVAPVKPTYPPTLGRYRLGNPEEPDATALCRVKRELMDRHSTNHDAYTDGKARFVEDILRKAAASC